MFVEVSRKKYEELKEMLKEMGIDFEASDCTLPGDKEQMVHVEIAGPKILTTQQVQQINQIFGVATLTEDKDGNGRPDYLDAEPQYVERRHRKWDDKMHTLGQEALGYFTGKSTEETVTVERAD